MQFIERKTEIVENKQLSHDWSRTFKFMLYGAVIEGPLMYTWVVKVLPRLAPINTLTTKSKYTSLAYKLLLESVLFAPVYNALMIVAISGLKGNYKPDTILKE